MSEAPINPAPFLTFLTPTFRRPWRLKACLDSVSRQTAAADIQQVVFPDHVGYGVQGGLYGRMGTFAKVVEGAYVHILCDDDVLADETVVEQVKACAEAHGQPDVILVRTKKGHLDLPLMADPLAEPVMGHVDLGSYIVRSDVWREHLPDYGGRYEGDFDHASALHRAGRRQVYLPLLFSIGCQSHGRPEV